MDCSTPGLPVHHQLPEFTQTHVNWVGDAIQSSHPLSSPSPAFNLSQHQGLFQWDSSSHQVAKVLELQLQHQSSQWIFRTDLRIDLLALVTIHFTYLSYAFTISPRKYTLPRRRDLCPICFQFCSHWLESITSCTSVHICWTKGLSRVFSNTTVQKHQFFGAQPSSQSNSHIHTWPQEKP